MLTFQLLVLFSLAMGHHSHYMQETQILPVNLEGL